MLLYLHMNPLTVEQTAELLEIPEILKSLKNHIMYYNITIERNNDDIHVKTGTRTISVMKSRDLCNFRNELSCHYMFNKMKELEQQVKDLTKTVETNQNNNVIIIKHEGGDDSGDESGNDYEEEFIEVKEKPKNKNMTIAEYKKICEKISRDNQYYRLKLVLKQPINYPDGPLTVHHNINPGFNYSGPVGTKLPKGNYYQLFSYSLHEGNGVNYMEYETRINSNNRIIETKNTLEIIRYQNTLGGSFILFENDKIIIFIKGITEPNVFDKIDQLKTNYELE